VRADPGEYFQRARAVGLLVFVPYHESLHERGDSTVTYFTPSLRLEHPTRGDARRKGPTQFRNKRIHLVR
jgi:hypothetical protein